MLTLDVLDRATAEIRRVPLPLADQNEPREARLELAPGADGLQVLVREDGKVVSWIEIPAQPGERLTVRFEANSGTVRAFCPHRDFLLLPAEEPPPPLLLRPSQSDELDLLILVDGTCLHPAGPQGLEYLLGPQLADIWRDFAKRLRDCAGLACARYPKFWAMAAAFGDQPMPALANSFLKPVYLVHPPIPEGRRLEPIGLEPLEEQLLDLPPSPGGDFLDGLADGLRAARQARWRQSSRKLLIVFGHSPGYSLVEPPDPLTNLAVREACVEEEIDALHQSGVEVMTVFHDPPGAQDRYSADLPELLARARDQYTRLATLPEWTQTSDADFSSAIKKWLDPPLILARGPAPGLCVKDSA